MSFESGEMDGQDFAFGVIGVIILIMMAGTFFEGMGYSNFTQWGSGGSDEQNFTERVLQSDFDLGDTVVNIKDSPVRQAPAGASLGGQRKGTKGRVMEGPVQAGGVDWWRTEYPAAPSGWVLASDITNKTGLYTVMNIVPITFGLLSPIAVVLSIIIFVLILLVALKLRAVNKMLERKARLAHEQKIIDEGHDSSSRESEGYEKSPEREPDALGYETEIHYDEEDETGPAVSPIPNLPVGEKPPTEDLSSRRWANIQSLITSYNQNDWKQAIIEADTILEEMLDKMGYKGDSIGDRLKKIEPSDFLTLNHAWEAHKVRNRIAHSGSNFTLSKNEAEHVIDLYKEVFREFFFI